MDFTIKTMAEYAAEGKSPEVLFWVGCAGSFDDRAKKITKAFAKILNKVGVEFAVLGQEESCTGDPAKRAGNEFIFQMMALTNIEVLNAYEVKKIVTACPHCFNTLKNEYPSLGGNYEVMHHTQLLQQLMEQGRLKIEGGAFKGKKITFHDPCYLGRANDEYEAPRVLLEKLDAELVEMKRCKTNGLCCGAGGAQMFKEPENPTEILGWIPINNGCYGENPFIFPELFDKHCTTYTNLKNLIKPFLLDRSMIIRTDIILAKL